MSPNDKPKDRPEGSAAAHADASATGTSSRRIFLAIDDDEDSKPVRITPLPPVLTPPGDDGA